jgi:hypothetical protein
MYDRIYVRYRYLKSMTTTLRSLAGTAGARADRASDTILAMRPIKTTLVLWALALPFVLAPVADATNDGRGFYGATNDKVVTDAGFILIVFFPLFVFFMSMLQRALDKRKEARKAAYKAQLTNAHLRGGW